MKVQLLRQDPEIVLFGDFLSQGEARSLLALAQGHFESSKVTCETAGGCVSSYRTSATAYLPRTELTRSIAARGMRLARLPFAEDLQIVRYFPGQEFKPHLDAFDPKTFEGRAELASYGGRQRDATFLIYLNQPQSGGSTRFTELGLEVAPREGAALYWRNVQADGRIDSRTRHAGMPVVSGVKYAVNLWIRGESALKGIGSSSKVGALRNFDRKRIGRLGEFRPSLEEDAKKFNLAVDRRPHTGTGHTLAKMAAYIREGSVSPSMKQFAEMVVRASGAEPHVSISNTQAAQILLSYVKKNVRYRPDPDNIEFVQKGEITLCVPGAQMCIPVGDCDDETVALGSLMGAYGIPVKILKQTFGDDAAEEHVLLIFKTDDGKWLPADATAPMDVGVGWRAKASQEVVIDPLDPNDTGTQASEFVGIGKLGKKMGQTSTHDQAVVLQTRLQDIALATALAIEACRGKGGGPASGLSVLQQTQWTDLAQRVLAYVSADPDTVDLPMGQALATELAAWSTALSAAGCTPAVPAPVPLPAPPPPSGGCAQEDWSGTVKLGLYAVIFGIGAYALTEAVTIARIWPELVGTIRGHGSAAAGESKRLVSGRRRV